MRPSLGGIVIRCFMIADVPPITCLDRGSGSSTVSDCGELLIMCESLAISLLSCAGTIDEYESNLVTQRAAMFLSRDLLMILQEL